MDKIVRLGDDFNAVDENGKDTYSVRNLMNMHALSLSEDMARYRKGEKELAEQIALETNVLNALAEASKAMR